MRNCRPVRILIPILIMISLYSHAQSAMHQKQDPAAQLKI
jgi:hypothetical protein